MNRLITAYVADTSACPKRQAVFYLRESNEPCADKTDDSRCELAHNRMAAGLDVYGERRDIELKRSGNEMAAWRIAEQMDTVHRQDR